MENQIENENGNWEYALVYRDYMSFCQDWLSKGPFRVHMGGGAS